MALSVLDRLAEAPDGRVVVVTGITPTSAGEGKTTTSIGLAQGMGRVGARALLCLREPSMGPVFGAENLARSSSTCTRSGSRRWWG